MHEIVTGQRTVSEAGDTYAEQTSAYTMGRSVRYAERLLFDPPRGGPVELDEMIITGLMAGQMVGKVKDSATGEQGR